MGYKKTHNLPYLEGGNDHLFLIDSVHSFTKTQRSLSLLEEPGSINNIQKNIQLVKENKAS